MMTILKGFRGNTKTHEKSDTKSPVKTAPIVNAIDDIKSKYELESLLFWRPKKGSDNTAVLTAEEKSQFIFVKAKYKDDDILCVFISSQASSEGAKRFSRYLLLAKKLGLSKHVKISVTPGLLSILKSELKSDDNGIPLSDLEKAFDQWLEHAIELDSSDIHIENFGSRADILMRVHGVLVKRGEEDGKVITEMLSSIYNCIADESAKDQQYDPKKVQQGVIERKIQGSDYRVRLQSAPAYPEGYTVVLRVLKLDPQATRSMVDLGYDEEQTHLLEKAQMMPSGAIIFAGTTGSGKSTTLSTLIADKYKKTNRSKKIITIESPPEYVITGARQIPMHEAEADTEETINHRFNTLIRASMRMDPDAIMVGEVRDENTAVLLQRAVQSGHQVFTTVHAQSALGIIERLSGFGFDRDILTSPKFLSLLVYQSLVPINCEKCRFTFQEYIERNKDDKTGGLIERFGDVFEHYHLKAGNVLDGITFRNVKGCEHCKYLGLVGRTVVAELVEPTPALLEALKQRNHEQAYKVWREGGGKTIVEHGLSKVFKGHIDPFLLEEQVGQINRDDMRSRLDEKVYLNVFEEFRHNNN